MSGVSRRPALVTAATVAAGLAVGRRPGTGHAGPDRDRVAAAEPPWVGAYAGAQSGSADPTALWTEADREIGAGQLTYRRTSTR